jgi:hypothetical protein
MLVVVLRSALNRNFVATSHAFKVLKDSIQNEVERMARQSRSIDAHLYSIAWSANPAEALPRFELLKCLFVRAASVHPSMRPCDVFNDARGRLDASDSKELLALRDALLEAEHASTLRLAAVASAPLPHLPSRASSRRRRCRKLPYSPSGISIVERPQVVQFTSAFVSLLSCREHCI